MPLSGEYYNNTLCIHIPHHVQASISGLVVKFAPATGKPRVRFSADAFLLPQMAILFYPLTDQISWKSSSNL